MGVVFYVYVQSQQRYTTRTLSRYSVGVHRLNVTTKRKTVALKVMLRSSSGGLGQNRTADTRIFNRFFKKKLFEINNFLKLYSELCSATLKFKYLNFHIFLIAPLFVPPLYCTQSFLPSVST